MCSLSASGTPTGLPRRAANAMTLSEIGTASATNGKSSVMAACPFSVLEQRHRGKEAVREIHSGVAHEDLRRWEVVAEESEGRPDDDRGDEHHIAIPVGASDEPQGHRGDEDGARGESPSIPSIRLMALTTISTQRMVSGRSNTPVAIDSPNGLVMRGIPSP